MKTKIILSLAALVVAGGIIAGGLFKRTPVGETAVPKTVTHTILATVEPTSAEPPTTMAIPSETVASVPESKPEIHAATNAIAPQKIKKITSQKNSSPKEPIQDPDARAALSFVGADPAAEQYWMAAINNPDLPPNERKDLIEDLNEDGLSDPKNPGAQDLPLILNRIQLIEQMAPSAMDQVNAEAFQEAYKDLVNLAQGGTAQ